MTPDQGAAMVLRGLNSRRTLVSPPWVRAGAVLSQAAPTTAARLAGVGGDVAARLLRRDRPARPAGRGRA